MKPQGLMKQFLAHAKEVGISPHSIAKRTGIHHNTVYAWGGGADPYLTTFEDACRAVGLRLVLEKETPAEAGES